MNILRWSAIRIGSISWMPRLLPQIVKCDNALQSLTRGRMTLLDVATLPNITLRVPGRKSGVMRETRLLAVPDGTDWLIAGSYFGGPTTPQWVYNLRAAQAPQVVHHGAATVVLATELSGADREQAWRALREVWPNFDLYEQRTDRRIPVFRLTAR